MTDKPRLRVYPSAPAIMGGAYDAGDKFERSLASWNPPERSADGDILPAKRASDARSRDAVRNDSFMASGVDLHRDSIVGAMFMLNCKPRTKVLGLDDMWAEEFQEEVEQKFTCWSESLNYWVDASRHNTFTSMIRLGVGTYVINGELLATAEWMRESMRPYRTAIQMIDPARLSNPWNIPYDLTNRTRGGVKLTAHGAPRGYYIRRELPGTWAFNDYRDTWKWSYIRAYNAIGRPQVIHIVEQERPGQTRGMSQLVTALKEMKILRSFRDVSLQAAALNASFAASIESELPTTQIFEDLGANSEQVQETIENYAVGYFNAINEFTDSAKNMQVDGVKIPHFFPGTKMTMNRMAAPDGMGMDFEHSVLRYIAAALNVSYEQLSKDYTETNYSSARAGMLETWKFMRARKAMVANRLASQIFRLWFEEAVNAGDISSMMAQSVPNMYDGMNMDAFTSCDWIGAGYGQIDEYKETQAAELRIKAGISTYEEEIARYGGKDWRQVFKQREREQKMIEDLGLTLSTNMPVPMEEDANGSDDDNDDTGRSNGQRRNDND